MLNAAFIVFLTGMAPERAACPNPDANCQKGWDVENFWTLQE